MEFGAIVRQRRLERGWNVQTMGEKSSLTGATISRIENGKSIPLVESIIRLCETLNINPKEFIHIGNIDNFHIRIRPQPMSKESAYLSRYDLRLLTSLLSSKPLSTFNVLLDITKNEVKSDYVNKSFYWYIFSQKPIKADNNIQDNVIGFFQSIDYPQDITRQIILDTNNNNGAIMLIDAGNYLKSVRKERGLSLIELQNIVDMPESALSNWENAGYKNIKFDDVLVLDKALRTYGEFTTLVWNASEFYPFIEDGKLSRGLSNQEITMCNGILSLYRHLQSQDASSSSQWLSSIRSLYKHNK